MGPFAPAATQTDRAAQRLAIELPTHPLPPHRSAPQLLRRALRLQQATHEHIQVAPPGARALPQGVPAYPEFTGERHDG
jgi:hypothetical protein